MQTQTVELETKKNEDNAEVISAEVEALERIARRNGGALETRAVVDAARSPDSPLHKHFTWDDTAAADAYRLHQARKLIRQYEVTVVVRPDAPPVRVPMFVNIKTVDETTDERAQHYVRTTDALKDPVRRRIVLERAMREATMWAEKYKHLEELSHIVGVILS